MRARVHAFESVEPKGQVEPRGQQDESTTAREPYKPRVGWRKAAMGAVAAIFGATFLSAVCVFAFTERPTVRVIPGEFEQHDLLLVAWPIDDPRDDLKSTHTKILTDIIAAVEDQIEVAVLTIDEASREEAASVLFAKNTPPRRHRFLQAPSQTIWVRDYGPIVAKSFHGGHEIVDTVYRHKRFKELDEVPAILKGSLVLPSIDVPIVVENGNLASNGAGMCVTTEKLIFDNGKSPSQITKLLRKYLGAEQVVFLENLTSEPTGHVDVFLTFTAPDTVVVGQYSRSYDPENAEILDRNANRLKGINTACGPLKVHRVLMPTRSDEHWRSFTNVVYANGVLLVPAYGEDYREAQNQAMALYRRLLPTWKVVEIDCSRLIQSDGALHCVTMNVYRAGNLGSSN